MPQGPDAHSCLFRHLADTHRSAGGVGRAAAEIAVAQGATVIGTAGERNHEFLSALGATATTYGTGLAERVSALAPDGIDVALDTAASGSLSDLVVIVGDPTRVSMSPSSVRALRSDNDLRKC